MKRSSALVDYEGSSEEELESKEPAKKRKLPALSSSMVIPVPVDDPSRHQGRTRSTPHVEGQWAVHVYVPVIVERSSRICQLLRQVFETVKESVPPLQSLSGLDTEQPPSKNLELHISLSRPVFVRAYQREEIKRCVRQIAQSNSPFRASFSSFSVFTNDEKTRSFLAVDIGGGFKELKALSDGLTPKLQTLRQKAYYCDPRFHASFAWALLDPFSAKGSQTSSEKDGDVVVSSEAASTVCDEDVDIVTSVSLSTNFPRIPHFPESLATTLNDRYKTTLNSKSGIFDVQRVNVKIGKEIFSWTLRG